jgi:hypothetical protein
MKKIVFILTLIALPLIAQGPDVCKDQQKEVLQLRQQNAQLRQQIAQAQFLLAKRDEQDANDALRQVDSVKSSDVK